MSYSRRAEVSNTVYNLVNGKVIQASLFDLEYELKGFNDGIITGRWHAKFWCASKTRKCYADISYVSRIYVPPAFSGKWIDDGLLVVEDDI